uniref:Coiled-coil alpha-helical rod protein 1 n=1 Tax=Mucochytrium quahogii TaxID=96639 RepID=A0A7S2WRQ8_9STRA|mmetsp:Transcript_28698/g.46363  ORF Transcript_28698/g.46363 Transcript_28698/m.46363 type:complete len:786 (+) Transcript_28698:194-2551(+)
MSAAIAALSPALIERIKSTYGDLSVLDLSNNRIEKIENLQKLGSLKELDLSCNAVRYLCLYDLRALEQLESINLSRNEISFVSSGRPGLDYHVLQLPPVKRLNLSLNPIRELKDLHGLDVLSGTLEDLVLQGTPLSSQLDYRTRIATRFPWLKRLDRVVLQPISEPKALRKINDERMKLENSRKALMEERVRMEQERTMVASLLERMEMKKLELKQASLVPTETSMTQTKSVDTKVSTTQVSMLFAETQTPQETLDMPVQTDNGQQEEKQIQTDTVGCREKDSQTSDSWELERLKKQNELERVVNEYSQKCVELDRLKVELEDTKTRSVHVQDKLRNLEREKAAWHSERSSLCLKINRKGFEDESRFAALEKLLIAQESAIVDASSCGNKDAARNLVQAWRKKVFALMIQQQSTSIANKRTAALVETERQQLLAELDRMREENISVMDDRNKSAILARELSQKLQNSIGTIKDLEDQVYQAKKLLLSANALCGNKMESSMNSRLNAFDERIRLMKHNTDRLIAVSKSKTKTIRDGQDRIKQLVAKNEQLCLLVDELQRNSQGDASRIGALEHSIDSYEKRIRTLERTLEETKLDADKNLTRAVENVTKSEQDRYDTLLEEHSAAKAQHNETMVQYRQLQRDMMRMKEAREKEEQSKIEYLEGRLARKESELYNIRKERNALLGTLRDAEKRGLLPGLGLVAPAQEALGSRQVAPPPYRPKKTPSRTEEASQPPSHTEETRTQNTSLADLAKHVLEEDVDDVSDTEDEILNMLMMRASLNRSKRLS